MTKKTCTPKRKALAKHSRKWVELEKEKHNANKNSSTQKKVIDKLKKWNSPENRKKRQAEYMKKHGPPPPRRKTLAVTDKHKEVRKILKDPAGFKTLKPMQKGGRAGFNKGKSVSKQQFHMLT